MEFLRWLRFDQTWDALAERGQCDARGGAEYQRVCLLWAVAPDNVNCETFIRFHANQMPLVEPLGNGSIGRGETPQGGTDAHER